MILSIWKQSWYQNNTFIYANTLCQHIKHVWINRHNPRIWPTVNHMSSLLLMLLNFSSTMQLITLLLYFIFSNIYILIKLINILLLYNFLYYLTIKVYLNTYFNTCISKTHYSHDHSNSCKITQLFIINKWYWKYHKSSDSCECCFISDIKWKCN